MRLADFEVPDKIQPVAGGVRINQMKLSRGFTLVELLIVLAIGGILIATSFNVLSKLPFDNQIEIVSEVKQALELTRERSIAGLGGASHGVYFSISHTGELLGYTIFRGENYSTRLTQFDQTFNFSNPPLINLNLTPSLSEISFTRFFGFPSIVGSIDFLSETGRSQLQITNLGLITLSK